MAARRGLVEDLLELGTRLSWKICLMAALASAVVLQGLGRLLIIKAPLEGLSGLGGYAARNLAGNVVQLLGVLVPLALAVAALISALRRSQAASIHQGVEARGIDAIRRLSWSQFERLIGEVFRRKAYEVEEAGKRGGDGGVDLSLTRNGRKYFVQCKHWRSQSVGVTVVRELNGVVAARGASGGFVVTSGAFTQEARAFAGTCSIELIDGEQLETVFHQLQAASGAGGTARFLPAPRVAQSCPKCGSAMIQRVAKKGSYAGREFWGCSRYPACRATIQIS